MWLWTAMFDTITMRSAVCFALSLQLLLLCYTSNLYFNVVLVNFMGFIVIRRLILLFQLIQSCSRPSFSLCNHCGYCTDVCACRHVGSMIRCGGARGFLKSGGNSHLIDIKTGLESHATVFLCYQNVILSPDKHPTYSWIQGTFSI